jgi:hypothetical protein
MCSTATTEARFSGQDKKPLQRWPNRVGIVDQQRGGAARVEERRICAWAEPWTGGDGGATSAPT